MKRFVLLFGLGVFLFVDMASESEAKAVAVVRAHGYAQPDDIDNGPLTNRVLTFVKKKDNTGIRVTYTDTRGLCNILHHTGVGHRWEIKFNGVSCTNPGPLAYDLILSEGHGDSNKHDIYQNITTVGTCYGLPKGTYTIQVYVGPISDLHPSWSADVDAVTGGYKMYNVGPDLVAVGIGYWSLETEEVK